MRTSSVVMVRWIVVSALIVLGPALSAAIQQFNLRVLGSNGSAAANLPVTMMNADGTGGGLGLTDDAGNIALALDPSKNKHRYNVYKVACSRIVFAEEGSAEDNRCKNDNGTEPNGCRSCEPLGAFIFGEDTTIGTLASGTGGFQIRVFATGGGQWTTIANAGDAVATIDARFSSATPPYNVPRQIDIEDSTGGGGVGGGVDFGDNFWIGGTVGGRVSAIRMFDRDVPTQNVRGTRDSGGLIFEQQGTSNLSSYLFNVGPTLQFGSVLLSGGLSAAKWNVDFLQTGSLRAGCPTPCQIVRTDNNVTTAKGTDIGYFAGVDWYPANSWLGLSATYAHMTLKNVYGPTDPLGWPADWTDNNLFVAVKIRTPNLIR